MYMEFQSTYLLQSKISPKYYCPTLLPHPHRRPYAVPRRRRLAPPLVTAVMTRPADGMVLRPPEIPSVVVTEKSGRYTDTWFDRIAIHYLSQCVQATTGLRNNKIGYDSLVEAATAVSRISNATQQRELVTMALERAFPKQILSLIRAVLPQSKFAREYFAIFTTVFFSWLVGPCEVRESKLNGRREKNVVYIKKCRFLEETNCVGMCSNLCKIPSQSFIKDSLGMPVNMVPNFEDKSCEMIFGEEPPAVMDDPAFKQPCYKFCNGKANIRHHKNCSS